MSNTTIPNNQWSNLFAGNNLEAEPNFVDVDSFPSKPKYPNPIASQYKSLYDELIAKCDFENFKDNTEKAKYANYLCGVLNTTKDSDRDVLIKIRNNAIEKLGIKISTEEEYKFLISYCNPSLFRDPYDQTKINMAIDFEEQIKKNADNILELEKIESKASSLIYDLAKLYIQKAEEYERKRQYTQAINVFKNIKIDISSQRSIDIQMIMNQMYLIKTRCRVERHIICGNYKEARMLLWQSITNNPANKDFYKEKHREVLRKINERDNRILKIVLVSVLVPLGIAALITFIIILTQ